MAEHESMLLARCGSVSASSTGPTRKVEHFVRFKLRWRHDLMVSEFILKFRMRSIKPN